MTRQRSAIAEELRQASKDNGPDPQLNTRLADVINKAKKIGFPKSSIENAVARGQGLSPSGAALENVTVEAMVPPSVAVIIECQTDSKLRTLSDMRLAIRESRGTVTPTNHLFERKGRVVFENTRNVIEADIFDRAIEAGAIDVEIEEGGNIVLTTESSKTTAVATALAQSSDFKLMGSDIIWEPKEDMMVDAVSPSDLLSFLGKCITNQISKTIADEEDRSDSRVPQCPRSLYK